MPTEIDPIIGNWYLHLEKGQPFTVVAMDEEQGIIEIQHYDGDIEEVAFDEWYEMNIAIGEEPESWAGAIDIGDIEDYGTEVTDTRPADWNDALSQFTKREKP